MPSKHRSESAAALGRMRQGLGSLFERATTRASEGAGRLREAARDLRGSSLLPQALAARERGNLEAAFWLLEEAWREEPDTAGVPAAFWDVAVELDRAQTAAPAAVSLVEHCAADGALELGAQYLAELCDAVPAALVKPTAVARLLPALRERIDKAGESERAAAEAVRKHAVGLALDPRNEAPGPGLAFHLFTEARGVHDAAARRAATIALESPDLHQAKRAQLCEFLGRPVPEPPEEPPPRPVERPAPVFTPPAPRPAKPAPEPPNEQASERLSEEEVAAAARRLAARHDPLAKACPQPEPPVERNLFHAVPVELDDEALVFRRPDGRASRIGWNEIEAVAVARIDPPGGEPVTVVDFVLNWLRRDRETLRLVRLRDDDFDPAELVTSGEDSLAGFLAEVLERSSAIPLPDPESALGLRPAAFDSMDAYELAVLGR